MLQRHLEKMEIFEKLGEIFFFFRNLEIQVKLVNLGVETVSVLGLESGK